jgi:predicted ester cyclase
MKKSLATILAVALLSFGTGALAAKKQSNRQVADHFIEVVDSKKLDRLGEVDASSIMVTTPMGTVKGVEGHAQLLKGFGTAFPNFKHTTAHCLESGDEISCEGTFMGDHTGPMTTPDGKVIPATQKHVEFPFGVFGKVKDGKFAQLRIYFDMMTFMQQLGLVPPPPSQTASK